MEQLEHGNRSTPRTRAVKWQPGHVSAQTRALPVTSTEIGDGGRGRVLCG